MTLLEFFGREDLNIDTLKEAESSGALEQLAKARQFFALSPRIAESAITGFRKQYDMNVPRDVSANSVYAG